MTKLSLAVALFAALTSVGAQARSTKKQVARKPPSLKSFKGQYLYELKFVDDSPVTGDCEKIEDQQVKKYGNLPCLKNDDDTGMRMFSDWSCSRKGKKGPSVEVVLGDQAKCEKALEDFHARF